MEKSEKKVCKSRFLRINGSPLTDYHHGLLITYDQDQSFLFLKLTKQEVAACVKEVWKEM